MKSRTTLFALFIMFAAVTAGRADEPRRGPLGLFNWQQTDTRPSVPWPSVPLETARATCLVSAAEQGTAAKALPDVIAVDEFDWHKLGGFIVVGLVIGVGGGAAGTFRGLTKNRVPATSKK